MLWALAFNDSAWFDGWSFLFSVAWPPRLSSGIVVRIILIHLFNPTKPYLHQQSELSTVLRYNQFGCVQVVFLHNCDLVLNHDHLCSKYNVEIGQRNTSATLRNIVVASSFLQTACGEKEEASAALRYSFYLIFEILNLGATLYLLKNSLKFTLIGLCVFAHKDMLTMTQLSTNAPFTGSNLPSQTAPSKLQPQQSRKFLTTFPLLLLVLGHPLPQLINFLHLLIAVLF